MSIKDGKLALPRNPGLAKFRLAIRSGGMTNRYLVIQLLRLHPRSTPEELFQLAFRTNAVPNHGVMEHDLRPVLGLLKREERIKDVDGRWELT